MCRRLKPLHGKTSVIPPLLWLMHKQKPDVKYRMHTFVYNLRVKACTVYAYWTDVWEPECEFY